MARHPDPADAPQDAPLRDHSFRRPQRLTGMNRARDHAVDEIATAEERASVAAFLDLLSVQKLRLTGTLSPASAGGWRFEGMLGATATQACVVTLQPVKTRIDVPVRRIYLPEAGEAQLGAEIEIDPEADEIDPMPETLDLGALAVEELALALPTYPRAQGVEEAAVTARPSGAAPIPEAEKPFAGLAALRAKLENGGN